MNVTSASTTQLKQAEQALRAGRFDDAERICRAVISATRDHPAALQLLGMALAQKGDFSNAETALRRAAVLAPNSPAVQTNLGNLLLLTKDAAGAERSFRQALALNPSFPDAHYNLGLSLKAQGRLDDAAASLHEAVRLRPTFADAWAQLGATLIAKNNNAGALAALDRAVVIRPEHYETQYNRGLALMAVARYTGAVDSLTKAVILRKDSHEACFALGHALHHARQFGLAVPAFTRAITLKPSDARSHSGLASALLDSGRPHEALQAVRRAIELGGDQASFYILLGRALADLNRLEESLAAHQRSAELDPSSAEALNFLGNAHLSVGAPDAARIAFDKALALAPRDVRTHYNLSRLGRFTSADPRLTDLEGFLSSEDSLPPADRARVHFALGKAYDEIGDYDRAFEHFRVGNAVQAGKASADESANQARFDVTKSLFTGEFVGTHSGIGSASDLPILIVGMPRTGTTLVEQILSSHPKVCGAGEVLELDVAVETARAKYGLKDQYPEFLRELPVEGFREIGDVYAERLTRRVPEAVPHITDKLPGNFHNIGLIHLVLPRAKIIHCIRNPMDTSLSCFTSHFGMGLTYFNDLGALGRLYRRYHDLMAHWRTVLPPVSFLDVVYEDLVKDFESGARRIVEYCGLDWDPRCLEFHTNIRAVNTVSVTQVRQPIYASSVERWRRYEKHLGPLIEALGDLGPR